MASDYVHSMWRLHCEQIIIVFSLRISAKWRFLHSNSTSKNATQLLAESLGWPTYQGPGVSFIFSHFSIVSCPTTSSLRQRIDEYDVTQCFWARKVFEFIDFKIEKIYVVICVAVPFRLVRWLPMFQRSLLPRSP
jgi:hypothetical protein